MRVGVYSDSLPRLSRTELFAWCAERGVTDIELGVGAWGPWPRPHLDIATVGDRKERDRLAGELRDHGMRLAAVNAAGNLLHPDPAKRADAQARFTAAKSRTSAAWMSKSRATSASFRRAPRQSLSMIRTRWPSLTKRRTNARPKKPVPPVTKVQPLIRSPP